MTMQITTGMMLLMISQQFIHMTNVQSVIPVSINEWRMSTQYNLGEQQKVSEYNMVLILSGMITVNALSSMIEDMYNTLPYLR